MDIKKVASYSNQKPAMVQEPELRQAEQNKAQTAKTNAAGEASDRVEFSKGYREIGKIKKLVTDMADVRMEHVKQIRSMIQSGTYKVDPDLVAGSILDELL